MKAVVVRKKGSEPFECILPTYDEYIGVYNAFTGNDTERTLQFRFAANQRCPRCSCDLWGYLLLAKTRREVRCRRCNHQWHPLGRSVFRGSTSPLAKWMYAMFLVYATRGRINVRQIHALSEVTYKCAYRMALTIARELPRLKDAASRYMSFSRHTEVFCSCHSTVECFWEVHEVMTIFGGMRTIAIPSLKDFTLGRLRYDELNRDQFAGGVKLRALSPSELRMTPEEADKLKAKAAQSKKDFERAISQLSDKHERRYWQNCMNALFGPHANHSSPAIDQLLEQRCDEEES